MPLQNRVDPFGAIHAHPARGLFTGNRGVIHDPDTKTLLARRWTTKAWIICTCSFRERRREVMGRNAPSGRAGWTELFFLDEVTALAAGHRPCFFCRRENASEFACCLAAGLGRPHVTAPEMDAILHRQRLAAGGRNAPLDDPSGAPDGTVLAAGGSAFARRGDRWLRWSFDGWCEATLPAGRATLLTPASTIGALRCGYVPAWHASAAS